MSKRGGESFGDWLRSRSPPEGLLSDDSSDVSLVRVDGGEPERLSGVGVANLQATGYKVEVLAMEDPVKGGSDLEQGVFPGFEEEVVEPVEVAGGGPSKEMAKQAEQGVVDRADHMRRRRLNQ